MKLFLRVLLALLLPVLLARGQAIDSLIASPDLWHTTRDAFSQQYGDTGSFSQQYGDTGFYWLSAAQERAEAQSSTLTLFSRPVCEVDVDFKDARVSAVTVSIYNRGDAGDITRDQMTALMTRTVQQLNTLTKVQYVDHGQEASDAVKASAFSWQTPVSDFLLEYSFTREVKTRGIPFRAEFIRLRITPAAKPKGFLAQALASASPQAQAFDGPSHVKKDASGDVRINTIPMVDEGRKAYCMPATVERIMRYYGLPVDEHEMAELGNTSATEGVDVETALDSLKKLGQRLQLKIRVLYGMDVSQCIDLINEYNRRAHRAHDPEISTQVQVLDMEQIYAAMNPALLKDARTHNQADVDRFQQTIQDHIDQGIPILWSVIVGIVPEKDIPPGIGGHTRLIIGYNAGTKEILYSDSWGPGYELERMSAADAWTITTEMDTIEPL